MLHRQPALEQWRVGCTASQREKTTLCLWHVYGWTCLKLSRVCRGSLRGPLRAPVRQQCAPLTQVLGFPTVV